MTLKYTIFILASALFLSCGENNTDSPDTDLTETHGDTTAGVEEFAETETEIVDSMGYNTMLISFDEFSIEMEQVYLMNELDETINFQKDTMRLFLELGEFIEGKRLVINTNPTDAIKIYQSFENSLTVMDEGPHCDLTEWEHYRSDWKEIVPENGTYQIHTYTDQERNEFFEVDLEDLQAVVQEHCGSEWAELIKNATSPTEYPYGVGMSRIFLKVELVRENSEMEEKLLVFEIPMGC